MRHHNSLLHELLKMVAWSKVDAAVETWGADRGVRTLDSKSHLVALLQAQLSGASSLREIEATMASQQARLYHLGVRAPKRSTWQTPMRRARRPCSPSFSPSFWPRRIAVCARPAARRSASSMRPVFP